MQALKRLAEWYLGIPSAEPGQGTAWRLELSAPATDWLPAWLVPLVILAGVGYVAWLYWRDAKAQRLAVRLALIGLRLSVIGMLVILLTELTLTIERTGLPAVVLAIDDSGSMGLEDQYSDKDVSAAVRQLADEAGRDAPTRLDLAKTVLTRDEGRFLRRLARQHTLRVYRFSENAVPVGGADYRGENGVADLVTLLDRLSPEGTQTRPGPAVRKILNDGRGAPPSAVVLFTDGITTTTDADRLSAVAELALSQGVPLYVVGLGSSEPARDLHLYDVLADEVAFVDDPIAFRAKLKAYGYAGRVVTVHLRDQASGAVLDRLEVQAAADGQPLSIELAYVPTVAGEFDYVLEAVADRSESHRDNNSEVRHVSVRDERVRVLLADSLPRYEFRYVKHLLERDKTVELHTVLQDADLDYAQEDATALAHFPVRREELLRYDVVILGDVNPDLLSAGVFETLREFVRDAGGGLLLVAGPQFNPLAYRGTALEVLLPVQLDRAAVPSESEGITELFQPQLTLEGRLSTPLFRFGDTERESLAVWNRLPKLLWLCEAPELKPGARVLVEHPLRSGQRGRLPVIAVQPYGAGKVLFHATDELWRWRLRAGDLYYGRYWIQAVRFLSRSKLIGRDRTAELAADRSLYQRGESAQLRVRFLEERLAPADDDGVVVMVENQGGSQQAARLQRVPGLASVFEGRVHRLRDGTYRAFVAQPSFPEAPPSVEFRVEAPRQELQKRSTDRADLQKAARLTHGNYYSLAEVESLPDDLPPGRPVTLERQEPRLLWNRWEPLLCLTLLLTGEWLLRKKCRLV